MTATGGREPEQSIPPPRHREPALPGEPGGPAEDRSRSRPGP
jgi:hypothetical protein